VLSVKSDWYEEDRAGRKYRYRVKIWDAEGFESWPGVKVPLRVLKIKEGRIDGSGKALSEPVLICEGGNRPSAATGNRFCVLKM